MRHARPSRLTFLRLRKKAARRLVLSHLLHPGSPRPDSRETSGWGEQVRKFPEVGEGTCQLPPRLCALEAPWGSRVSSGTGVRRSHGEAFRHSHSGLGPASAAAAPPFALHGARTSSSAASFCAWAACLFPLTFLCVSSPDCFNSRVAGPAVSQKRHV